MANENANTPMLVNGMGRIEINVESEDAKGAAKLIDTRTGDLEP